MIRRAVITLAMCCLAIGVSQACYAADGGEAAKVPAAETRSPVKKDSGTAGDTAPKTTETLRSDIEKMLPELNTGEGTSSMLKWAAVAAVLSIAPAILVMVTSFTRIAVVLGLLRQALGTQQLPPNQILFGLALLMTVVVMAPTYKAIHTDAIAPASSGKITHSQAVAIGEGHVRDFMTRQIEAAGNTEDVYLFLSAEAAAKEELTWGNVPTVSLIPAYVVSELKVAFWMGFRIYLPFLIIDMLVASVLVSMGMLMVPPVMISLPFKLLLFVLADGWHLVVGTLIKSFGGG